MPKSTADTPLAHARLAAGLTQQEVADRWSAVWPDDPKSAKRVHYWETGAATPSLPTLRRLARILGCRVGDLIDDEAPEPLAVALAIVVRGFDVLLVQNRDTGQWQFPAGTVKPGRDASRTAIRECLAETGVHADVVRSLGVRVHPKTRALCNYFACEHLAGEPVNADPDENTAAVWAPIRSLERFIPLTDIFPPALDHLQGARPCLSSTA